MTPAEGAGRLSKAAEGDRNLSWAIDLAVPLTETEQRELLDRERERMESPDYEDTLEDLSLAMEAHLQHHGRI